MELSKDLLLNALALLIMSNKLKEKHGEDVIGVLMKAGVFPGCVLLPTAFNDSNWNVAELAAQIEAKMSIITAERDRIKVLFK